jgi:hypothetical protein
MRGLLRGMESFLTVTDPRFLDALGLMKLPPGHPERGGLPRFAHRHAAGNWALLM